MPRITFEAETDIGLQNMVRAYWYGTPEGQKDLIQIGRYLGSIHEDADDAPDTEDKAPKTKPKAKRAPSRKKAAEKPAEEKEAAKPDDAPKDDPKDEPETAEADDGDEDAVPTLDHCRAVLGVLSETINGQDAMAPVMEFTEAPKKGKLSGIPEDKRADYIRTSVALVPSDKLAGFKAKLAEMGVTL